MARQWSSRSRVPARSSRWSARSLFVPPLVERLEDRLVLATTYFYSQNDVIYALSGGTATAVTSGEAPRVSPDARTLLFLRNTNASTTIEGRDVWSRDLVTGGEYKIYNGANATGSNGVLGYSFTPDSKQVVMDQNTRVLRLNREGTDLIQPFINSSYDAPDIEATQGRLAFHLNGGALNYAAADGSGITTIPNTVNGDLFVQWSNDSQWIAFQRTTGANPGYYKIRPDGTGLTQLSATTGGNGLGSLIATPPAWTQDDSALVIPGTFGGVAGLYTVPTAGGLTPTLLSATGATPPRFIGDVLDPAAPTRSTTITISSSVPQGSAYGTTPTFTINVAATSGITTGNVVLSINGGTRFTVPLSSGQATYTPSRLLAGPNTLSVQYSGAVGFSTSTETFFQAVASSPALPTGPSTVISYNGRVHIMALDGSVDYLVTTGERPLLSPDGRTLLFKRGPGTDVGSMPLFARDMNTNVEWSLRGASPTNGYGWAADSATFFYDAGADISQGDRDGLAATFRYSGTGFGGDDAPTVNPVTGGLAFHNVVNGAFGIYVGSATGTGRTLVPGTGFGDLWPSWSADGQWIAFKRGIGASPGRYKVRPDGTGLTQLSSETTLTSQNSPGIWSDDGLSLYIAGGDLSAAGIYSLNTNPGGPPATPVLTLSTPGMPSYLGNVVNTLSIAQGTRVSLTSSASGPVNAGTSVTFTATVSSAVGTPTGSITFTVDGASPQVVPLVAGVATFTTTILSAGVRAIMATYGGAAGFAAASTDTTHQIVHAVVSSATIRWNNASGGAWGTASNWDLGRVPGPGDDVIIPDLGTAGASLTVTFSTGSTAIRSLTSAENVTLSGGTLSITGSASFTTGTFLLSGAILSQATIAVGTTLRGQSPNTFSYGGTLDAVTVAGTLTVDSARLDVTGGLTVLGTANLSNYGSLRFDSSQTVRGTGTFVLNYGDLGTTVTTPVTLTLEQGLTLRGHSGFGIGSGNMSIVNRATLRSDNANGIFLVTPGVFFNDSTGRLQGTANQFTINSNRWEGPGRIEVSLPTNTQFQLGGNFPTTAVSNFQYTSGSVRLQGTLHNTGQTLVMNANTGSWRMEGGTILGGTIQTPSTQQLQGGTGGGSAGVLDGVILDGTYTQDASSSTLTLRNGINLTASAQLLVGVTNTGFVTFEGSQAVLGSGSFVFGTNSGSSVTHVTSGQTVNFGPSTRIRGTTGRLTTGGTISRFILQGTVSSTVSGQEIFVDLAQGGRNEGIVEATGGAFLTMISGTWAPGSTTRATGNSTLSIRGTPRNLGTLSSTSSTINLGPRNATDSSINNATVPDALTLASLGTFTRTGSTIRLTGLLLNAANMLDLTGLTDTWQLAGGTLLNGTLRTGVSQSLIATTAGGILDAVTLDGTFSMATVNGQIATIRNGLTMVPGSRVLVGTTNTTGNATLTLLGTQTITGSGEFVFGGASANLIRASGNGTVITLDPNITIRGNVGILDGNTSDTVPQKYLNRGTIRAETANGTIRFGRNTMDSINQGLVESAGGIAAIDGTNWTNTGTLRVGTGTVELSGSFSSTSIGTINRVAGAVTLTGVLTGDLTLTNALGSWNLSGGTLRNATFRIASGSTAQLVATATGGTLDNVVLANPVTTTTISGAVVTVTNGLTLNTTMTVGGSGNARILFSGTQTLRTDGGGTLTFGSSAANVIQPSVSGTVLTIGPGVTINGRSGLLGVVGNNAFSIVNQGTIRADVASGTFQAALGAGVNYGTISAAVATTLQIEGAWSNATQGVVTVSGGATLQTTLQAGNTWANYGVISATNATVLLAGTINQVALGDFRRTTATTVTLTGTWVGDLILDDTTGSWNFNGGTLRNGTLTTFGSAQLVVPGGNTEPTTLDRYTLSGTLNMSSGLGLMKVQVRDTLTLNTTLTLGGTSRGFLTFINTGSTTNATLDGPGTIQLVNASSLEVRDFVTLTMAETMTLSARQGANSFFGSGTMVNRGLIVATGPDLSPHSHTLKTESFFVFTNLGTVRAQNGARIGFNLSNSNVTLGASVGNNNVYFITLTGGRWEALSDGRVSLYHDPSRRYLVTTLSADVVVDGVNSLIEDTLPLPLQSYSSGSALTSLTRVSPSGSLTFRNGAKLTVLKDGLTNQGDISLGTSSGPTLEVRSSPTKPSLGLVSSWTLNGNATDSTGTNHGTLGGSASQHFAPGLRGQGLGTRTGDGWINVPDSASLRPAQITVEAWVWAAPPGAGTTMPNYSTIVSKTTGTALTDGFGLGFDANNALMFWVNNGTASGNFARLVDSTPLTRRQWAHVAGSYDGSTLRLYINGVLVASTPYSTPIAHSTQPLLIGNLPPLNRAWSGIVDDLGLYNRALTGLEIQALASTVPGTFVQQAGSTLLDGGSLMSGNTTVDIPGGILGGTGTVNGNVTNPTGIVSPGASPGTLDITGTYVQGPGATLRLELGGRIPGIQYDQLRVTGTASLAGTLEIPLVDDFLPVPGDEFRVLTSLSRSGNFSQVIRPSIGPSRRVEVLYEPTRLTLQSQTVPPLDFVYATTGGAPTPFDAVANKVVADVAGNAYVVGTFVGNADFDADRVYGDNRDLLTALDPAAFLAKYDPTGALLWVRKLDALGSATSDGLDVALNTLGNANPADDLVYITGSFTGTVSYGGGPLVTSAGLSDAFVLSVDAAGGGAILRRVGGTGPDDGRAIAVEATGRVWVTGAFYDTVDFDPGAGVANLTSTGAIDAYVLRLTATLDYMYADRLGGLGEDAGTGIATDGSDVWVVGEFRRTTTGLATLTAAGLAAENRPDAFVLRLTPSGLTYTAAVAQAIGGVGEDTAASVAVAPDGSALITGSFSFSVDFDVTPGAFTLASSGDTDAFVMKLSRLGTLLWARQFGGFRAETASDIFVDAGGNVYSTGIFKDIVDFNPEDGNYSLNANTDRDAYLSKIDADGHFVWAAQLGAQFNSRVKGFGLTVTGDGTVLGVGSFSGIADFDPSNATQLRTSRGDPDFYVTSLKQKAPPQVTLLGLPTTTIYEGTAVTLATSVVDPDSLGFTYAWAVTRDGEDFASGRGPALAFVPPDQGRYVVTVVVSDSDGNSGTASTTLLVGNAPPVLEGAGFGTATLVSNPTPAATDGFGTVLASTAVYLVVGVPRDDAGGTDSGVVHVYNAQTGAFLRTILNPATTTPGGDLFGSAVAISGTRVLVGAPSADANGGNGAAYLFDLTNGTLLTTFTGPNPGTAESYGAAVAAYGTQWAIGAPGKDTALGEGVGEAYLYDGATFGLVQTFRNPRAEPGDNFGAALTGAGYYLAIGEPNDDSGGVDAGAFYLFDPGTGQRVRTFVNPFSDNFSGDGFGSVLAYGNGRVYAGSPFDDTTSGNGGGVYVYDVDPSSRTFGSQLRTIRGPNANGQFGRSLAAQGNRILVGAATDPQGVSFSGTAFLVDGVSGVVLNSFKRVSPAGSDSFGIAVAFAGDDPVVGASADDTGATDNGAVYRFVTANFLGRSPATISENGTVTLSASFSDTGRTDRHRAIIDWRDGSPLTTLDLDSGITSFSVSHQYLDDNPTATTSDSQAISVRILDQTQDVITVSGIAQDTLLRYDGTTGLFTGTLVSAGTGLDASTGVAVGPDGNLYARGTGVNANRIVRFNGATGVFDAAITPVLSAGAFGFGPDGNLYALDRAGNRVLRYDPRTGAALPASGQTGAIFVPAGSGGLSDPTALAFGPDGTLYVSQEGVARPLLAFDGVTGAFLRTSATLTEPRQLVFAPNGDLHVASAGAGQVGRFDVNTGEDLGAIPIGSLVPGSILFGPNGRLLLTSSGTTDVLQYDGLTGEALGTLVPGGSGGLTNPGALVLFSPQDSTVETITITNVNPTVGITTAPGSSTTRVNLIAAVLDPGSQDTFTYSWSVSGGTPIGATNTANFSYTPTSAGMSVLLTVTDDDGGTSTFRAQVVLATASPDTITLNNSSSILNGVTTFYSGGQQKIIVLGLGGNDGITASAVTNFPVELIGGDGNDTLTGSTLDDLLVGNNVGDYDLAGALGGAGDHGNDSLSGGTGNDTLDGGLGDDTLAGGTGNDLYLEVPGSADLLVESNSAGTDTIDFGKAYFGISLSLAKSTSTPQIVNSNFSHTVALQGEFENLTGSGFSDSLSGNRLSNTIRGGAGNDQIFGGDPLDAGIVGLSTFNDNDSLLGGLGNDTVLGGAGNDIIFGGDPLEVGLSAELGNDCILGGAGNDTVLGGAGNDIIFGGDPLDLTLGFSANNSDSILGGLGNDTVLGGSGNDIIFGGDPLDVSLGITFNGDDSVLGGVGNDTVLGGTGNDIIFGGDPLDVGLSVSNGGNDCLLGGLGNDTVLGGSGNDIIFGGDPLDVGFSAVTGGNDSILGGQGNDTVLGGSGNDIIFGGDPLDVGLGITFNGNDSILGGQGNDTVLGGSGNDIIFGGDPLEATSGLATDGSDSLLGGLGNDTVLGGAGNDIIFGGDPLDVSLGIPFNGDDSILGGIGNDTVLGGTGNDIIFGGDPLDVNLSTQISGGDDSLLGGIGNDTVLGGSGNDIIFGGDPLDVSLGVAFNGDDSLLGGLGNDTVLGGTGNDIIYGGLGEDVLTGDTGTDVFDGGLGIDRLFEPSDGEVNLGVTTVTFGETEPERFYDVEEVVLSGGTGDNLLDARSFPGPVTLIGGAGSDTLLGSAFADLLLGGDGDDSLSGGDGDDTLDGGAGDDSVDGGLGNDVNVHVPGSTDVFSDTQGIDGLDLSGARQGVALDLGLSTMQVLDVAGNRLLLNGTYENAFGTGGSDFLKGNDERNILAGGGGRDRIEGGLGDDTVQGDVTQVVYLDFDRATGRGERSYSIAERNSIQARLEADFRTPFSFTFTQTQPALGKYVTLQFNAGDAEALVAGVAEELDWRNLNLVSLAGINVTGFLGNRRQPAATPENYIGLSASVAAHELAHLVGLRHYDAFGPLGINPMTGLPFGIPASLIERSISRNETISHPGGGTTLLYPLRSAPILAGPVNQAGNSTPTSHPAPSGTVSDGTTVVATFTVAPSGQLNLQQVGSPTRRVLSGTLDFESGILTLVWSAAPGSNQVVVNYDYDPFRPGFRGPDDANETRFHILSSPASTGSTVADAAQDTYFGERELIKLAYANAGIAIAENAATPRQQVTIGGTTYQAQDLGILPALAVPNLLPNGTFNFGKTFNVRALSVIGTIDRTANGTGPSENDVYAISGQAGDLVNLEVYSNAIRSRLSNTIDGILRVYDAAGNLLPYFGTPAVGDDSFDSPDPVLFDLILPATGTYFVMVDTFTSGTVPDVDIGGYELFVSTFSTNGPRLGGEGDRVIGGEGHDVLAGSVADDRYIGDRTEDIFLGATPDDREGEGNTAPVATPESYPAFESQPLLVGGQGILANDTDADQDVLSAVLVSGPQHGTLTLRPDGSFVYIAAANFSGLDSFIYQASDGLDLSNPVQVTFNVAQFNDPPGTMDDTYMTEEDSELDVPAPGVLGNDEDPEGGALTAILVTPPTRGTLTFRPDGSFLYRPNANINGTDSFTYQASDGNSLSGMTTVRITIVAVDDPPTAMDDTYMVDEDNVLTVSLPGVLANDSDIDSAMITAVLQTNPTLGSLSLNPDGSFTYTPFANVHGDDSFTYLAFDDQTPSAPATVRITIRSINDAPLANSDFYPTTQGTPLSIDAPGVLENDGDDDGDALTAVLSDGPSNGTLELMPDGSFLYTPDAEFYGEDIFYYRAFDGQLYSEEVSVAIVVSRANRPPVAVDDAYSTELDQPLLEFAPGVLANDFDPDLDRFRLEPVTTTTHGSLTLNPDGSFDYYPDSGFLGDDTFTYRIFDGQAYSRTATVIISVRPPNQAPTARADFYSMEPNNVLYIPGPGILVNDTDPENDILQPFLETRPQHGTLVFLGSDGSFFYSPDPDFIGEDSFTYRAYDGNRFSDIATVSIDIAPINQPPVANDDSYQILEDHPLIELAPGVIFNDFDPENDNLTAALVTPPLHGILIFNDDGSFTYEPDLDYNGSDSFTYTLFDSAGNIGNSATVYLDILAEPDAPRGSPDTYTLDQDNSLEVTAPGVLSNDFDPDGDTVFAMLHTDVENGTLTFALDGSFDYIPNPGYYGTDSFLYYPTDGTLDGDPITVTLTVRRVNQPPSASDENYSLDEDTTLSVLAPGVLDNDTDPDLDSLTTILVTGPTHGTLTLNPDGSFIYTPNPDYSGNDFFTYRANDGIDASEPATVYLEVIPINDAPVARDNSYTFDEDTTLDVAAPGILSNDIDADGDTLIPMLVDDTQYGILEFRSDGSFVYTPNSDYYGTDTFTYRLSDGSLESDLATVTLTIRPVNDAPIMANQEYFLSQGQTLNVAAPGVLQYASDADGDMLTPILVSPPSHGMLTLEQDGSFQYIPDSGYSGPDSFLIRVTDEQLESNDASVDLSVYALPNAVEDRYLLAIRNTNLMVSAPGLLENDSDPSGFAFQVLSHTNPSHGAVSVQTDGSFVYTPNNNFTGDDSFTYTIRNIVGGTATATVHIHVNAPPSVTITGAPVSSPEGTMLTLGSTITDPDPGSGLTYSWRVEKNGSFYQGGNNSTLTFTPDDNGNYVVRLTVMDGYGSSGEAASQAITVTHEKPTATLSNNGPVLAGAPVRIAFSGSFDPSIRDRDAGFLYSYDFNNNNSFADPGEAEDISAATRDVIFAMPGDYTVRARIKDKDGAFTDYTTVVQVQAATTLAMQTEATVEALQGQSTGLMALATFTDSAGPRPATAYAATITWGNGTNSNGTITVNGAGVVTVSGTVTYATNGIQRPTILLTVVGSTDPGATASPTIRVAEDVTSRTQATLGGLVYNRTDGLTYQNVTVRNTSAASLSGGLRFHLQGLTAGVSLAGATVTINGVTTELAVTLTASGAPLIEIPRNLVASLAPGQTLALRLRFRIPTGLALAYSWKSYSAPWAN